MVRPTFELDERSVGPVVEICRRLDALPLAIELAAARIRMMSPTAIATALDDRFRVLGGGGRTLMARQQTLRASVDWSLRPPRTRSSRRCCAACRSSSGRSPSQAPRPSPVATTSIRYAVLDWLDQLVDKSLVQAEPEAATSPGSACSRPSVSTPPNDSSTPATSRRPATATCSGSPTSAVEQPTGLDGPELERWVPHAERGARQRLVRVRLGGRATGQPRHVGDVRCAHVLVGERGAVRRGPAMVRRVRRRGARRFPGSTARSPMGCHPPRPLRR